MCIFNPPHLIVFANFQPYEDALSYDRWKIITLEGKAKSIKKEDIEKITINFDEEFIEMGALPVAMLPHPSEAGGPVKAPPVAALASIPGDDPDTAPLPDENLEFLEREQKRRKLEYEEEITYFNNVRDYFTK